MVERSFRIDEQTYTCLKEISLKETVPVSYLVRLALRRLLDDYVDGFDIL